MVVQIDWGSTANPDENRIETWGLSGSFIFGELIDASWLDFGKLELDILNLLYFLVLMQLLQYTT